MAFTSHGHHISGTILGEKRPSNPDRCGGLSICSRCKKDALEYHETHSQSEVYLPTDVNNVRINFVGEVPVTDKPGGNVIGKAKMEKLGSGAIVAHIVMDPGHAEAIFSGFQIGQFSLRDEDGDASPT